MIIIEIYNILLLLLSKPTNSFPLYFSSPIGNEKCVTLAQFNMTSILLSYHIGYMIMICVWYKSYEYHKSKLLLQYRIDGLLTP